VVEEDSLIQSKTLLSELKTATTKNGNQVFNFMSLATDKLAALKRHIHDMMSTGDKIILPVNVHGHEFQQEMAVVRRGEKYSLQEDDKALYLTFDENAGKGQAVELSLEKELQRLEYDETSSMLRTNSRTVRLGDEFNMFGKTIIAVKGSVMLLYKEALPVSVPPPPKIRHRRRKNKSVSSKPLLVRGRKFSDLGVRGVCTFNDQKGDLLVEVFIPQSGQTSKVSILRSDWQTCVSDGSNSNTLSADICEHVLLNLNLVGDENNLQVIFGQPCASVEPDEVADDTEILKRGDRFAMVSHLACSVSILDIEALSYERLLQKGAAVSESEYGVANLAHLISNTSSLQVNKISSLVLEQPISQVAHQVCDVSVMTIAEVQPITSVKGEIGVSVTSHLLCDVSSLSVSALSATWISEIAHQVCKVSALQPASALESIPLPLATFVSEASLQVSNVSSLNPVPALLAMFISEASHQIAKATSLDTVPALTVQDPLKHVQSEVSIFFSRSIKSFDLDQSIQTGTDLDLDFEIDLKEIENLMRPIELVSQGTTPSQITHMCSPVSIMKTLNEIFESQVSGPAHMVSGPMVLEANPLSLLYEVSGVSHAVSPTSELSIHTFDRAYDVSQASHVIGGASSLTVEVVSCLTTENANIHYEMSAHSHCVCAASAIDVPDISSIGDDNLVSQASHVLSGVSCFNVLGVNPMQTEYGISCVSNFTTKTVLLSTPPLMPIQQSLAVANSLHQVCGVSMLNLKDVDVHYDLSMASHVSAAACGLSVLSVQALEPQASVSSVSHEVSGTSYFNIDKVGVHYDLSMASHASSKVCELVVPKMAALKELQVSKIPHQVAGISCLRADLVFVQYDASMVSHVSARSCMMAVQTLTPSEADVMGDFEMFEIEERALGDESMMVMNQGDVMMQKKMPCLSKFSEAMVQPVGNVGASTHIAGGVSELKFPAVLLRSKPIGMEACATHQGTAASMVGPVLLVTLAQEPPCQAARQAHQVGGVVSVEGLGRVPKARPDSRVKSVESVMGRRFLVDVMGYSGDRRLTVRYMDTKHWRAREAIVTENRIRALGLTPGALSVDEKLRLGRLALVRTMMKRQLENIYKAVVEVNGQKMLVHLSEHRRAMDVAWLQPDMGKTGHLCAVASDFGLEDGVNIFTISLPEKVEVARNLIERRLAQEARLVQAATPMTLVEGYLSEKMETAVSCGRTSALSHRKEDSVVVAPNQLAPVERFKEKELISDNLSVAMSQAMSKGRSSALGHQAAGTQRFTCSIAVEIVEFVEEQEQQIELVDAYPTKSLKRAREGGQFSFFSHGGLHGVHQLIKMKPIRAKKQIDPIAQGVRFTHCFDVKPVVRMCSETMKSMEVIIEDKDMIQSPSTFYSRFTPSTANNSGPSDWVLLETGQTTPATLKVPDSRGSLNSAGSSRSLNSSRGGGLRSLESFESGEFEFDIDFNALEHFADDQEEDDEHAIDIGAFIPAGASVAWDPVAKKRDRAALWLQICARKAKAAYLVCEDLSALLTLELVEQLDYFRSVGQI